MTITLNGSDLTVTQVLAVARHGEAVALAPEAVAAMRQARAVVQEVLATGEPVYGLTTGVGERKSFLLKEAERQRFNHRLVLNHRIAQGDAAPADVVRGAMVCLANSYAKGVTGVRPELAEMIVTLLNEGFVPPVRTLGSIGQGDLGPMADLAHGLITRSGFEVAENEGLALVSNNAFTTSWACLAVADAYTLMDTFDVAGALDLEGFGANLTSLHPVIEQTRPFPGLAATLARLRLLLTGSYLWQPGTARFLQDPLTFRCIPHIHGAARDALAYTRTILQLELSSSQSNPVVVVPDRAIVSVGNFDIGPLATALDLARIALAPVVTSANERAVKLLQAPFSGLPAGLAAVSATPDDALSELATSGQAITVEARTLAHPVSYELASSVKGDGIEDRATMAPLSARRLAEMIALATRVAAIELVVAAQAVDLRAHSGCGPLGLGTGRAYRMVRDLVPFTQADGTLPADLEPVVALVARGDLNPPDPARLTCLDSRLPCRRAARGNRRERRRRGRRGNPRPSRQARPGQPVPQPRMKITAIRLDRMRLPLDPPFYAAWDPVPRRHFDATLVRVQTDEGITGHGSGDTMDGFEPFEPLLVGRDPLNIADHVRTLESIGFHAGRYWPVEAALWDILGQVTGQPVSVLFGGATRRLPAYASFGEARSPAARAEAALAAKSAGFQAMKIRISRTDPGSSLAAVRATRAAVGDGIAIMADLNQWWRMAGDISPALDLAAVRRIAAELADLGVFWLEEPLPGGDLDGMRALRQQIRVAGGEMARTPAELLSALEAGAVDVLQPDVVLAVGMLRTRTIAELALLRHRWFTPHTWTNGLGLLANLHVVAGVGGGPYVEFPYDPPGWTEERRDFFLADPIRIDAHGYLTVPSAPGLGAVIDPDALTRYARSS